MKDVSSSFEEPPTTVDLDLARFEEKIIKN